MYRDVLKIGNIRYRKFDKNISQEDLMWHRDERHRLVIPVLNFNWKIQKDNEFPKLIIFPTFIKKDTWHRVIAGKHSLRMIIIEFTRIY
jgi:hypothetical protein